MNANIIRSLATIAVVGAVAAGTTYAWFNSQRSSVGNTFSSGSVNLQLADNNEVYKDQVSASWAYSAMVPGGTPNEDTLWLKNTGTVKTDLIDLSLANGNDNGSGLEKQIRITKMTLDGKTLLKGGAGADQSSYAVPTVCDYTVDGGAGDRITTVLAAAPAGKVVCVKPGTYSTAYEGSPITISKAVTLVSLEGPENTTIGASGTSGGISINADNVTLKGFTIDPDTDFAGNAAAVSVNNAGAQILDNVITGVKGNGQGTIKGIHAYTAGAFSGLNIANNIIKNVANTGKGADGIMIQGLISNTTITHNTIKDISSNQTNYAWDYAAGIEDTPTSGTPNSSPLSLTVTDNHIENITSATEPGRGFAVDKASDTNYGDSSQVTFARNNIVNIANQITNKDLDTGHTLNAQNNWFGDFTPNVNINGAAKGEVGAIDTSNFAGNAFAGFVNGNDGNANGFADMQDLRVDPIAGSVFEMLPDDPKELVMAVQLDGPTTGNEFQNQTLTTDVVVKISQMPQ